MTVATFAFQETAVDDITVNWINPLILFFAIKSTIKTQVTVDMLLLGAAMVGASRHDSQLMLFMGHNGKG